MAIRVALHHKTVYSYDREVELGPQAVRLRPAPHCRTPILSYSLQVEPGPPGQGHFINWQQDPHGNYLARLVFPEKVRQFGVEVDLVADMTVINPFEFFLEKSAENYPFAYEPDLLRELQPYLETLEAGKGISASFESFLADVDRTPRRVVDFLVDLNASVNRTLAYTLRMDPGVQTPEETLKAKRGSCRDMAWLMVHLLRRCGLAARFVSGYSIQLVADLKPIDPDAPAGVAQDVTDLHAWTEVYLPGAGWVGMDATSGLMCGEGHLPLACSPSPTSAAPITGTVGESQVSFDVDMSVSRIHEDPRVTKPYTDDQWSEMVELGKSVDASLNQNDVRLSMGGEPTFVSLDDPDGEEWNTAAVGVAKMELSEKLIRRLRNRFGPGGLLHFAQGKWYPGEPLPRWSLNCYWRRDGEPIWSDESLFADGGRDYGFDHTHAARFIHELAKVLEVTPKYVNAAFEDHEYVEKMRHRLPVNVTPEDNRLEDPLESARLKRLAEKGTREPVGFVLPLERRRTFHGPTWHSGLWMLRGRRIPLVPGDSPIGLRLPLDSLPWVKEEDPARLAPQDPMERRGSLPTHEFVRSQRVAHRAPLNRTEPDRQEIVPQRLGEEPFEGDPSNPADRAPRVGESARWVTRSALCVEPRGGRLYVFLPPTRRVEDYLDLINALETTAANLGMPVIIEGYTPPSDHRLECIKVTPDPGVIEVNVHPAHSWEQLARDTESLYHEARQCRLGAEKFMTDGRHTGTGGGNHVVIGAAKPLDSPLLRRPDLLRSLVSYWNNHPSLSYLFSGLFIGPTSQAPRVDEGRADSIYELEIANGLVPDPPIDPATRIAQTADLAESFPPWLTDRVYRHLLTDLTGNTHRAEFCIDKLYSPDAPSGRLGLLEFRGFEMPPHWRMSLAQTLLLRALIARFWERPYKARLKRWGAQLHDRFLLPHFCREDFAGVIEELNDCGFGFDLSWYEPFFEFRFPVHGRVTYDSITIELRQAIEPWLVLGEEQGGGGTARYVDSSVERMQVKVSGMTGGIGGRHAIAVNGIGLPLTATGRTGEYVAGLRYRAWQPASCLHPTIAPHSPLVFDLVDTWAGSSGASGRTDGQGKAIGGCTYHVAHPGGRSYETFPVNALEAEARRVTRFFTHGHSPGPMRIRTVEPSAEMPLTLDLRRT